MRTLGLDIGGANLKASDGEGLSVSIPFPMWLEWKRLPVALSELIDQFGAINRLAVTMTGELADCFATKSAGVNFILDAVVEAADKREALIWQSGGEFVDVATAREITSLVAAANWHALATWCARLTTSGHGVLIDIGSTTTDIIPLERGVAMPTGRTDPERLLSGELLYFGVRRTPLIGVLHTATLSGVERPLANELFATTYDVFLVLNELPEQPESTDTANSRPATIEEAFSRLARQLCGDTDEFTRDELREFAEQCRATLIGRGVSALRTVYEGNIPETVIVSGEGGFLAEHLISKCFNGSSEILNLRSTLGELHSNCACAFALARLGTEQPEEIAWL
ncbi:MAG: hypothetical protein KDA88_18050 [Planctomycetaceae bacterium]|nr:hypothetical protein [Planctomycetaceae bacterium]